MMILVGSDGLDQSTCKEFSMENVVQFPTPRERAGVSMVEDKDLLLDSLFDAAVAIKNSENVADDEREDDLQIIINLFVKYVTLRGERYPSEEEQ